MLSQVHAIVRAIEEEKTDVVALVIDLHHTLQNRPPTAQDSWNSACLLWDSVVCVARAVCSSTSNSAQSNGRRLTFEEWQPVHALCCELLHWSTEQGSQQMSSHPALHAMTLQLRLFDAEVHAAHQDWETTWRLLQHVDASVQTLVYEEQEDNHSTALLFQLFTLQLVAAWRLGHASAAEDSYTLCKDIISSAHESHIDKVPLVQILIAKHLEQVTVLLRAPCHTNSINLAWRILQQAEAYLETEIEVSGANSDHSWAGSMLSQVPSSK
eukprot:jgi/Ulvmu1/8216/UM041_0025.1